MELITFLYPPTPRPVIDVLVAKAWFIKLI